MARKEIDISSRYKDYTATMTLNQLPANNQQMAALLAFPDYVRARKDVSVEIRVDGEEYEDEVPQRVLLTKSPDGFYMELNYSMDDWGWKHPLLLANDHLTEDEAKAVIISIFHECTDSIWIIQEGFKDISSEVYPEDDPEKGDA